MDEPLLPLHREYTDKEKLQQSRQYVKSLNIRIDLLELKIKTLQRENFDLKQKLIQEKDEFPDEFNGSKYITAKAYNKLKKRADDYEKWFWEQWELNNKSEK